LLLKKLLNIPPDFAKSNVIEMLENESDCLAFLLTGLGNLFAITGRRNCALSLAGQKINSVLKLYLYLTIRKSGLSKLTTSVPAYHGVLF